MPPVSAALLKLFQALPIFAGLGDEEIFNLAQLSTQQLFPGGSTVFKQGDPGTEAYIIVRGSVDIILDGHETPLARIRSGNIFGELAFLDGAPRTANAVTAEPTILLAMPREEFDMMRVMDPNLGMIVIYNLALALAAKLRHTDQMMHG